MAPPPGVSWGEHFQNLQKQYPTPSDVPNIDLPKGTTTPPATWREWAKAWKAYYDSTDPADHPPPSDGRPALPPPNSSREVWNEWAQSLGSFAEKK